MGVDADAWDPDDIAAAAADMLATPPVAIGWFGGVEEVVEFAEEFVRDDSNEVLKMDEPPVCSKLPLARADASSILSRLVIVW